MAPLCLARRLPLSPSLPLLAFEWILARIDTCTSRPTPTSLRTSAGILLTCLGKGSDGGNVESEVRSSVCLLSVRPGMICGLRLHWCLLDASYRWLRTVVPSLVSPCCLPPCVRRGGVNISNLRLIWRSKQPQGKVSLFHVALINVRSLVKKNIYIKLLFYCLLLMPYV